MARQLINSKRVTPYRNPLHHAAKIGNLVFLSGITPFKGAREIAVGDFPAQMRQAMTNVRNILEDCGSSLGQVAKLNIYLRRESDFKQMNDVYREFFPAEDFPARTTVIAASLSGEHFLVQIDGIAEVSSN